jgi:hypothetical protein
METWFELAPYFAVDEQDGLKRAADQAKMERDEIDAFVKGEVLSELPDTLTELIDDIGDETFIYQLADVLDAQSGCAFCDCPIVRVDSLVENILDYYDEDEDPGGALRSAIANSGMEIGDWDQHSLCSYHGEVMSRSC